MKKIVTILILTYCALASNLKAVETEVVEIKDNNLKSCISSTLNVEADALTKQNLESIYSLNCSGQDISNLSGLAYATNIQTLNLSSNNISNISELKSLTKLTNLDLNTNEITNISSLENLEYLRDLNLSNNRVSNISYLRNLVILNRLNLANNRVSNIDDLSTLSELKQLILYQNSVTDLSGLSSLTQLTQLLLDDNKISDITPLRNLKKLKILSLNDNKLSSLKQLSNISSLIYLSVENNQLSDLVGIEANISLSELYVENNNIKDISVISNLINLKIVNISDNQIDELVSLTTNTNIETLFAQGNKISDLSGLEQLSQLANLKLNDNSISDISLLSNLTNLTELDLSENLLSDISPISSLVNLEKLYVNSNNIDNISYLRNLTNCQVQVNDQLITLPYIQIDPEATYTVIDSQGNSHEVAVKKIFFFARKGVGTWNINTSKISFSGEVRQELARTSILTASSNEDLTEDSPKTDQQLISLFNVKNDQNMPVKVDQTQVNYFKPGKYNVTFTDSDGNEAKSTLNIIDVKPKITVQVPSLNLILGAEITNYKSVYGAVATEHKTGDLNSKIKVDDSAVDYSKEGTYKIKFTVKDSENNLASRTVKLTIARKKVVLDTDSVIHVYKTNRKGKGLSGYEYTIYDKDGNIVEVIVTDGNGHANSITLPAGEYYLQQTGAPAGDNINEEIISISETVNIVEAYNPRYNSEQDGKQDGEQAQENKEKENVNLKDLSPATVNLKINVILENGKPVENIGLYLLSDNKEIFGYQSSDENGQLEFTNAEVGEYQLLIDDVSGTQYKLYSEYFITIEGTENKDTEHDIIIIKRTAIPVLPIALLVIISGLILIYVKRKK